MRSGTEVKWELWVRLEFWFILNAFGGGQGSTRVFQPKTHTKANVPCMTSGPSRFFDLIILSLCYLFFFCQFWNVSTCNMSVNMWWLMLLLSLPSLSFAESVVATEKPSSLTPSSSSAAVSGLSAANPTSSTSSSTVSPVMQSPATPTILQDPSLLRQLLPALQTALQLNNASVDMAKINEGNFVTILKFHLACQTHSSKHSWQIDWYHVSVLRLVALLGQVKILCSSLIGDRKVQESAGPCIAQVKLRQSVTTILLKFHFSNAAGKWVQILKFYHINKCFSEFNYSNVFAHVNCN